MNIKVYMTAFGKPDEIRMVELPLGLEIKDQASDQFLDYVYHYGQNDIQPQQHCSVSIGDVIESSDCRLFMVCGPGGFKEITNEQFDYFKALDRQDRLFDELTRVRKVKPCPSN